MLAGANNMTIIIYIMNICKSKYLQTIKVK